MVDLLARVTIADCKAAARRLVAQGGAYLNNAVIDSPDRRVTTQDLLTESLMVLRGGKKTHRLVRAV